MNNILEVFHIKRLSEEIEYVDVDKLKPMPNNPRVNDDAAEKLAEVIKRYGFLVPIIATKDNIIRAGHTRLKAAKILKYTQVPVIYVEFESSEEAVAFAIVENRSHEWSDWDQKKLLEIFNSIDLSNEDLEKLTGFSQKEFNKISESIQIPDLEELDADWKVNREYTITFRYPIKYKPVFKQFIHEYGKKRLQHLILEIVSNQKGG